jgi:hypothetical protein
MKKLVAKFLLLSLVGVASTPLALTANGASAGALNIHINTPTVNVHPAIPHVQLKSFSTGVTQTTTVGSTTGRGGTGVFQLNRETGSIQFGNGPKGQVPPAGRGVSGSYRGVTGTYKYQESKIYLPISKQATTSVEDPGLWSPATGLPTTAPRSSATRQRR